MTFLYIKIIFILCHWRLGRYQYSDPNAMTEALVCGNR